MSGDAIEILAADDDGTFRKYYESVLKEWGYSVVTVKNGKEAIDQLKEKDFDLVILDIIMAEMSGIEVFHWMRKNRPEVKVIFVSALSECAADEVKGAYGFLSKPFSKQALIQLIEETVWRQNLKAG